jgi:hypothetical protein
MNRWKRITPKYVLLSLIVLIPMAARADSVTDWNKRACDMAAPANLDNVAFAD